MRWGARPEEHRALGGSSRAGRTGGSGGVSVSVSVSVSVRAPEAGGVVVGGELGRARGGAAGGPPGGAVARRRRQRERPWPAGAPLRYGAGGGGGGGGRRFPSTPTATAGTGRGGAIPPHTHPTPPRCRRASVSAAAVPEISLWTVVAAVQAVERKVESQALRLLSLEGRAETAEKKVTGLEKAVLDFGSRLERKWAALAALVQENTRRLEHVERQLQHQSRWAPRPGPGPGGDEPKVTGPHNGDVPTVTGTSPS
uniref:Uncharacterized protein n=1 Tax=Aquila chrysaetos chrysaetos TaxID=223781 RepID=A0A663FDQ8_AQUCH